MIIKTGRIKYVMMFALMGIMVIQLLDHVLLNVPNRPQVMLVISLREKYVYNGVILRMMFMRIIQRGNVLLLNVQQDIIEVYSQTVMGWHIRYVSKFVL